VNQIYYGKIEKAIMKKKSGEIKKKRKKKTTMHIIPLFYMLRMNPHIITVEKKQIIIMN